MCIIIFLPTQVRLRIRNGTSAFGGNDCLESVEYYHNLPASLGCLAGAEPRQPGARTLEGKRIRAVSLLSCMHDLHSHHIPVEIHIITGIPSYATFLYLIWEGSLQLPSSSSSSLSGKEVLLFLQRLCSDFADLRSISIGFNFPAPQISTNNPLRIGASSTAWNKMEEIVRFSWR